MKARLTAQQAALRDQTGSAGDPPPARSGSETRSHGGQADIRGPGIVVPRELQWAVGAADALDVRADWGCGD